jgi:hypothetical protein
MAVLTLRANQERLRAGKERLSAEREATFLADMFRAATPAEARGRTVTARELLDRGASRVDKEFASDPMPPCFTPSPMLMCGSGSTARRRSSPSALSSSVATRWDPKIPPRPSRCSSLQKEAIPRTGSSSLSLVASATGFATGRPDDAWTAIAPVMSLRSHAPESVPRPGIRSINNSAR